jgi:hypothetical protein
VGLPTWIEALTTHFELEGGNGLSDSGGFLRFEIADADSVTLCIVVANSQAAVTPLASRTT